MKKLITFSLILLCNRSIFSSEEQTRPLSPNPQVTKLQNEATTLEQLTVSIKDGTTTLQQQQLEDMDDIADNKSCCNRDCIRNGIEHCCLGTFTFGILDAATNNAPLSFALTLYVIADLRDYQQQRNNFNHQKME